MVHVLAMMFANRLSHAHNIGELQTAEQSLNRFSRTFCAQVEVIDHRNASDQKIVSRPASGAQAPIDFNGNRVPLDHVKPAETFNGHAST
jgi:hypothetical protein